MPTLKEIQELVNNCSWEEISVNGVKGALVTGSNGNSIFLPHTGVRRDENDYGTDSFYGNYWSATMEYGYQDWAYTLECARGKGAWAGIKRHDGLCIRPVTE